MFSDKSINSFNIEGKKGFLFIFSPNFILQFIYNSSLLFYCKINIFSFIRLIFFLNLYFTKKYSKFSINLTFA